MAVIESKKKLGFGMMRLPERTDTEKGELDNIDVEQVKEMVDTFIARGFTYFDTAWMYHNKNSEQVVKLALTDRYSHDRYTLADKYHLAYVKDGTPEEVFLAQLERCGVEYFDYYLLHALDAEHYKTVKRLDCFGFAMQKKAEGKVKHVGFSFHDSAEVLDQILTEHPEAEFVQLQLNYLDWTMQDAKAKCELLRRYNIPIWVMEPIRGGRLASLTPEDEARLRALHPEESVAAWAFRFLQGVEGVQMILSGMTTPEQMQDNVRTFAERRPLTIKIMNQLPGQRLPCLRQFFRVGCDGSPRRPLGFQQAARFQFGQRALHGIRVDLRLSGEVAHAGNFFSRRIFAGDDGKFQLFDQLDINRPSGGYVPIHGGCLLCACIKRLIQ